MSGELVITGRAARKIGRLSALRPDAAIQIEDIVVNGEASGALKVLFLDEYEQDVVARFAVREDGWSNPSLARAKAEISR